MEVIPSADPVGYGFRPTDEELVDHYLKFKIKGEHRKVVAISEVDVCRCEPWDLPDLSVIKNKDPEWFFFCPLKRKYRKSRRSHRATEAGYWKATGKDRCVRNRYSKSIGMKKTLVFHIGRAPGGKKTDWIMHEYRTNSEEDAFVLCRLFNKEKADDPNWDEIEPTGSSPTTTNSSLEGTPLDPVLVPASSESCFQAEEQTSVDRFLADKSEKTPYAQLADDSNFNSCRASDVEDHGTEVDTQQEDYLSVFNDSPFGLDLVPCATDMSTAPEYTPPYSNDFANTEMPFLDSSNEAEFFLEKILLGQNESCDESSSQKHLIVENEQGSAGNGMCIQTIMTESEFGKESVSCSDTDSEGLQQASSRLENYLCYIQSVDTIDPLDTKMSPQCGRTEASYSADLRGEDVNFLRDASLANSATYFSGFEGTPRVNHDTFIHKNSETGKVTHSSLQPSSNYLEGQSGHNHVPEGSLHKVVHDLHEPSSNYLEGKSDPIFLGSADYSPVFQDSADYDPVFQSCGDDGLVFQGSADYDPVFQSCGDDDLVFQGSADLNPVFPGVAKGMSGRPVFQGFARRRIRLQKHYSELEKAKPTVTETAGEASVVAMEKSQELQYELNYNLGGRSSALEDPQPYVMVPRARRSRYSCRYMVLVALVIILVVLLVWVWGCLVI